MSEGRLLEKQTTGGVEEMGWGLQKIDRLFLNAVFWIVHTEISWRDLPSDYGDWEKYSSTFLSLEGQRHLE